MRGDPERCAVLAEKNSGHNARLTIKDHPNKEHLLMAQRRTAAASVICSRSATVQRLHSERHRQLREHLADSSLAGGGGSDPIRAIYWRETSANSAMRLSARRSRRQSSRLIFSIIIT